MSAFQTGGATIENAQTLCSRRVYTWDQKLTTIQKRSRDRESQFSQVYVVAMPMRQRQTIPSQDFWWRYAPSTGTVFQGKNKYFVCVNKLFLVS